MLLIEKQLLLVTTCPVIQHPSKHCSNEVADSGTAE